MMWLYAPGMAWWMIVSMVLWLLLLGVAVWAFVRWVAHQTRAELSRTSHLSSDSASDVSALEILRRRFARGEIDSATFEDMRQRLQASGAREQADESQSVT